MTGDVTLALLLEDGGEFGGFHVRLVACGLELGDDFPCVVDRVTGARRRCGNSRCESPGLVRRVTVLVMVRSLLGRGWVQGSWGVLSTSGARFLYAVLIWVRACQKAASRVPAVRQSCAIWRFCARNVRAERWMEGVRRLARQNAWAKAAGR
jgi:hypothetical protein